MQLKVTNFGLIKTAQATCTGLVFSWYEEHLFLSFAAMTENLDVNQTDDDR